MNEVMIIKLNCFFGINNCYNVLIADFFDDFVSASRWATENGFDIVDFF